MTGCEADAFAATLHKEIVDKGFTHAEAVEIVEDCRQRRYWDEVAELWLTHRTESPWGMLGARRDDEIRASDYDDLNPYARLIKLLDARPDVAAALLDHLEEELVFEGMMQQFDLNDG